MDKSVIPRQLSDLKVAFLRDLYNETFSLVTWDSLFVRNGLERVSQDTGSCAEVGLQHFSMNGVYAWGFSTLHSFDGVFDFRFCIVLWHK